MTTPAPPLIAIVGHGIIGASWALVFARAGFPVRVWARSEASAAAARHNVAAIVESIAGTGAEGGADTQDRISYHRDIAQALGQATYIQESVPEQIELKREVFAAIEEAAPATTVIGSSTSGIMPTQLAEKLKFPGRLLVVHPLTPPHLLPVTEICIGPLTNAPDVERTMDLLRSVGQHPVLLQGEQPGFAINRLLGALFRECFSLIKAGVIRVEDVDALFTEGFGLRWSVIGPLAAMDLNAPGGIRDYLQRYGKVFDLNDPALVEHIANRFEAHCAKGDRTERARRRDRSIAQVGRFKRTLRPD